jgi:hypothetical protein
LAHGQIRQLLGLCSIAQHAVQIEEASVATEFSELAVYRFGASEAFCLESALVMRLALFCDFAVKRLRVGRFAGVPDSGRS